MITSLTPLGEDDLVRVLTEPKNALVRQYQSLFEMENCDLSFNETALRAIAKRAIEKETGARGLRSSIENVMLDIMYDLPEQQEGTRFEITDEVVEGRAQLFKLPERLPKPETKSA